MLCAMYWLRRSTIEESTWRVSLKDFGTNTQKSESSARFKLARRHCRSILNERICWSGSDISEKG